MQYPGNETLAEEIRERILNTFRQTLDLAERGDQREAQLGCDFVLRLDQMFEPARQLNERLQKGSGPVAVADLRAAVGTGNTDQPSQSAAPGAGRSAADPQVGRPPVGPRQPAFDADEPAFELDLDAQPDALDSALDLSSLEPRAAAKPPSSPPPAAADGNQPSTGSQPIAALDTESERRIQDLLGEGQDAFNRAEYQSAIDSWSRIFLIDIDHGEATRRIDLARKLRAEVERKLDELYHDAVTKVKSGRLDEARKGFAAVLEMMPGHVTAQEYLARLDAPGFEVPGPAAQSESSALPRESVADAFASAGEYPDDFDDSLANEILTPPAPARVKPPPAIGGVGRATKPARPANHTFKIVGVAALVLLVVVGWLLYKNRASFFPNTSDQVAPVQLDPITRAKRTYAEAGAAIAIAQLRRLSPGHAQYAEAQALVAQWEAALDAANADKNEPAPEALAARDRLVVQARAAFAQQHYLPAQELLEQGAARAPLDEAAAQMLEETKRQLAPMQAEIAMFRDGEWELALRNLWRLWESGSNTPDVRRLMVDSYFNLGVRDLQRNDPGAAILNLREAADLAGEDAELARLIGFTTTYQSRPQDLLYRIFVKYLPFR